MNVKYALYNWYSGDLLAIYDSREEVIEELNVMFSRQIERHTQPTNPAGVEVIKVPASYDPPTKVKEFTRLCRNCHVMGDLKNAVAYYNGWREYEGEFSQRTYREVKKALTP